MLLTVAENVFGRTVVHVRRPSHRHLLARIIARARRRPAAKTAASGAVVDAIEAEGFAMVTLPFDRDRLMRLKAEIQARLCMDQWRPELGKFRMENPPAGTNAARVLGVESIPDAIELANHPEIMAVASNYLGCRPTIDAILAWWSYPERDAPIQEQYFHRDNPSVRFLKLFVYLTDVDDECGPHVFVRGSHNTEECVRPIGQRFTDEEVEALVGADRIKKFTGPFGTAFFEDTFGLHKGELPARGQRLIFQVTYSVMRSPPPIRKVAWREMEKSSPFEM